MRSSSTEMKSRPCLLQLEKARGRQQRPSATKNKNILKKEKRKKWCRFSVPPTCHPLAQLPRTELCIWMRLPGGVCGVVDFLRGRLRMQTVVRQHAWCVNILSQWEAGSLVRPTLAKGPKPLFLFLENSVSFQDNQGIIQQGTACKVVASWEGHRLKIRLIACDAPIG